MKEYLKKLVEGQDLTSQEAEAAMDEIMEGKATEAQIGSYLTALHIKGETIDEITASAKVMRAKCNRLKADFDVLDIVGTGGDCSNTFNISTISSFVIAAAGVKVGKHGNRSVSSKCGSADVLEALGIKLDVTKEQNEAILKDVGLCFMFAPLYHSSMRYVAKPRKEMGIPTIFNILGPLASPAYASLQVLGVYKEELVETMAKVLNNLGVKHAMVVYGQDGIDEVSLCAPTSVCEIKNGKIESYVLDPREYGFSFCKPEELKGGAAAENKEIALSILNGKQGPKRDVVVLNSAVALKTAFDNLDMKACINLAKEMLDSKKALYKMEEFAKATHRYDEVDK